MSGGASPNPYSSRTPQYAGQYGNTPDYGAPNPDFAEPKGSSDAPYNDEYGWAPKTRISVLGTPDAMREMEFPVREYGPGDNEAPQPFYRRLDNETKARESETHTDAIGWNEQKDSYKIGRNPREIPPPETRWTERLSPASYSFTRPFDQGTKGNGARTFNGVHFSMADHRRTYDVMGMKPTAQRRNTFRIDPAPWDADMYDVPPTADTGVYSAGRVQAVELPVDYSQRSYRL